MFGIYCFIKRNGPCYPPSTDCTLHFWPSDDVEAWGCSVNRQIIKFWYAVDKSVSFLVTFISTLLLTLWLVPTIETEESHLVIVYTLIHLFLTCVSKLWTEWPVLLPGSMEIFSLTMKRLNVSWPHSYWFWGLGHMYCSVALCLSCTLTCKSDCYIQKHFHVQRRMCNTV